MLTAYRGQSNLHCRQNLKENTADEMEQRDMGLEYQEKVSQVTSK